MSETPPPGETRVERHPHLDEHLCIDLLQGFLSPAETETILAHAADCPSCERLLRERAGDDERIAATMIVRARSDGSIILERRGSAVRVRERAEGVLRRMVRRTQEQLAGAVRVPRYGVVGAVAAAAVVALVLQWPRDDEISRVLELQALPSYSFRLESRDVSASRVREALESGLRAYDEREFETAARLLQAVDASALDDVDRTVHRIYLGSALTWSGHHETAVEILESVPLSSVPGSWGREARWTLFVALKGAGRDASADSLLQILVRTPGEIGERARRVAEP